MTQMFKVTTVAGTDLVGSYEDCAERVKFNAVNAITRALKSKMTRATPAEVEAYFQHSEDLFAGKREEKAQEIRWNDFAEAWGYNPQFTPEAFIDSGLPNDFISDIIEGRVSPGRLSEEGVYEDEADRPAYHEMDVILAGRQSFRVDGAALIHKKRRTGRPARPEPQEMAATLRMWEAGAADLQSLVRRMDRTVQS